MDRLGPSTQLTIKCSQCQGDNKFLCKTCKRYLCLLCREKHAFDLDTIYHIVDNVNFDHIPRQENCVRHGDILDMFCQSCELAVCSQCFEHRTHQILDITTAYQTKRQQHRETIDNIRSKTLYNCHFFRANIKTVMKSCPKQISQKESQMLRKAKGLKDLIDTVVCDSKKQYRGLLIDRIQQQKRTMNTQLVYLQDYEDRYEQSANRAVQFLLFINTSRVPKINDSHSQLLSAITEIHKTTGKQQVEIHGWLKQMFTPVLHTSVSVTDVRCVLHISCVMSDRVLVSDECNLILTDTAGVAIHRVTDISTPCFRGLHTINKSGELIYIDMKNDIKKLSTDNKTVTMLLETTSPWLPHCVYSSPSTGDLVVGMYKNDTVTSKITRYNSSGQNILTTEYSNEGNLLYTRPFYITENMNGDIIVSDFVRGVVVTERGGRHRFTYTGPPSGSPLVPHGICTDAFSHILVCDTNTHSVQVIDKDGCFLSLLLTKQHGVYYPQSLSYDSKSHLLWVGSQKNNRVFVYRYIQREYSLDCYPDRDGVQEPGTELEITPSLAKAMKN